MLNIDQQTEGENVEYRSTNRRESVEYQHTEGERYTNRRERVWNIDQQHRRGEC